ncbi:MAG TPA: DUF2937 family protein [Stellaceae bacterium]|nr:DUF2937 family protein [Stellaceae bacterium]
MRFLRRWLSHSIRLGLALFLALVLMQAPAFTADYVNALLQVGSDARRDIDQREAAARHYYNIPPGDDASLIAALKPHEPANAATLALSLDRASSLIAARQRILARPAVIQPLAAIADAARDPNGYKAAVWRTELATYTVHLDLTLAAIGYGIVGLMLGSLLGHAICLTFEPRAEARRFAKI